MTWKIFERILEAPHRIEVSLVVDGLIPALAWAMHEACGTEVLFYVKRTVEEDYEPSGDGARLTLYLVVKDPARDIHVPRQRASEHDVEVADPPPLEYSYAVVHTHPRGVTRFSSTDKEYINVNHPVSVLVESGRVADAVVSLGLGSTVIQARPRVEVAERRFVVQALLPGGRSVETPLPSDAILKAYVDHILRHQLSGALERIEGCKAERRRRRR